ncbi:peptidoglycan DD-metalloendopeptidase family protein [Sphingosinithalassobacter sp. CS137]|uniref:peptidoglycan DD-metalloendopeptidase family protein n=1 Tax=Sphingosinithalassobacter sp. CS137 TaxID=2762748 RepID=UPI00165E3E8A|nr:peptidoglycan DD-metalloendopeptidase family protein [Sphingosinithalassobacter sp. CS137]
MLNLRPIGKWTLPAAAALALAGCIPAGEPRRAAGPPPAPQSSQIDSDIRRLPAEPNAWEARTVTADAAVVGSTTYTVRSGDTLRGIANRTGAGSEAIARANNLAAPFTIYPGQRLTIPAGRYHRVREGETGIAIARAYAVDWGRMVTLNELEEPYILRVGQRLLIPDDRPETLAQRAARFEIDIDDIVTGGEPALARNEAPATPTASSARVLPTTAAIAEPPRLTGQFQWPAQGTLLRRFGPGPSGERNDGIKIALPVNTPVVAAADGVVAYVGSDIPQLGGIVILRHGDGWTTVYGHAGQLLVQRGQSVERGQTIALSGDTGFVDQPQLHFEMRRSRAPVDPLERLPER